MTPSSAEEPLPLPIEPASATNWRAVTAVGVVVMLVLAGLGAMMALNAEPKPGPQPEAKPSPAESTFDPWALASLPAAPAKPELSVPSPAAPDERDARRRTLRDLRQNQTPTAVETSQPERIPRPAVVDAARRSADTSRAAEQPARSGAPPFSRRHSMPEYTLAAYLQDTTTELRVDATKGTSAWLMAQAGAARGKEDQAQHLLDLLSHRTDLAGLPLLKGGDCRREKEAVVKMDPLRTELRRALAGSVERGFNYINTSKLEQACDKVRELRSKEAVPMLVQIFQGEDNSVRSLLVRLLSRIEDPSASVALARLAVFDLSADVRQMAVEALKPRKGEDYRAVLLDGLRYPWPPAAEHAAEALVALQDRDALPRLAELLDEPDPAAPFLNKEKKYVVPELVRVNHLANCMLCHAPSFSEKEDSLRGVIPTPGQPIPREEYYGKSRGALVRADVTYLRQDFSVLHHVPNPNHWPVIQRSDYFIRTRELSAEEAEAVRRFQEANADKPAPFYPQRDAVLFVLRELTGKDAGDTAQAWKRALAEEEPERSP